jgi:hypothetical protein
MLCQATTKWPSASMPICGDSRASFTYSWAITSSPVETPLASYHWTKTLFSGSSSGIVTAWWLLTHAMANWPAAFIVTAGMI